MELTDLLGRIPAGFSVEMVDRKVIDPKTSKIVKRTSIDIVHADAAPFRFSSLEDVSAALELARAIGGVASTVVIQQRVISPPELPLAPAVEPKSTGNGQTLEEVAAELDDDDELPPPVEPSDDEQPEEAAPPPPPARPAPTIAPGGPVASQFAQRTASRRAKDKTAIVPAAPASV
jgi:hypothetical protein